MAHAKNISHLLSEGEIIVNLDADNFTGKDFAKYINQIFNKSENIILLSNRGDGSNGRICFLKKYFLGINGYDEKFKKNYYEEVDLIRRLKLKYNLFEVMIPIKFLEHIKNEVKNEENKKYREKLEQMIEKNKKLFEKNKKNNNLIVNKNGFGKGTFTKNFTKKIMINNYFLKKMKENYESYLN